MKFAGGRWGWVAVAALLAVGLPAWLLSPLRYSAPPPGRPAVARPQASADASLVAGSKLFRAEADGATTHMPEDAPELAGIIGRPPHDAVALIRSDGGGTRTLAPGQSFQGWRLEAVSAEAALFSRGPRQIRVTMPQADPTESPAQ